MQVSVSVVWVAEPPQSVPGWVVALAVLAGLLLLALLIFIMYKVRRRRELRPRSTSCSFMLLLLLLCSSGSSSECAPRRRTALRRSSCSRRRTATPTVRAPPVSERGATVEEKLMVAGLRRSLFVCLFVLSSPSVWRQVKVTRPDLGQSSCSRPLMMSSIPEGEGLMCGSDVSTSLLSLIGHLVHTVCTLNMKLLSLAASLAQSQ